MRYVYTGKFGDNTIEETSLEVVVRWWDHQSYNTIADGYINVRVYDSEGNCVRDGNVLHVQKGNVYLNPTIEIGH